MVLILLSAVTILATMAGSLLVVRSAVPVARGLRFLLLLGFIKGLNDGLLPHLDLLLQLLLSLLGCYHLLGCLYQHTLS